MRFLHLIVLVGALVVGFQLRNGYMSRMATVGLRPVRIAVVGDVHGEWKHVTDQKALQHIQPDLVLFTGDFGNEDVNMVKEVAKLDMPKAIILGNHDCWWSGLRDRGYKVQESLIKPNAVQEQISELGKFHVGFRRVDYPLLKLSVVGGRPFSLGGSKMFGHKHLASFYGVTDFNSSAQRITEAALGAPEDHSIIFLGHNGPTGLGSNTDDICGKDFEKGAGDHGDPDFEEALKFCEGKRGIPLVVFGHMHHKLSKNQGWRKMTAVGGKGTVYLNAAVVPRTRDSEREREFAVVKMVNNKVHNIVETWVRVEGEDVSTAEERVLFGSSKA